MFFEGDVCWVGIFGVVVFGMCLLFFVICDDETQNNIFVLFSFSLYCHYMQPAIVTTDALSGSYVIVVKVIPEKTSFRVVCTNDHSRSQFSTKLAQNLDYGRVGNQTILSGTLYRTLYPVTWSKAGQRTDWPDLIDLRIAWNCIKSARQLEECHVIIDQRLGSPTHLS